MTQDEPWHYSSRSKSPFVETHTSVYIPGEPSLPPGVSHDMAYEIAYDKIHFSSHVHHVGTQTLDSDSDSLYPSTIGLLKAQDQLFHAPVKVDDSSDLQDSQKEEEVMTYPARPRVGGKRHFSPDSSPLRDHLGNSWTGLSPIHSL